MCPYGAVSGQQVVEGRVKMEPIVSSETSAIRTQTPGNYPKRNNLHNLHYYTVQFPFGK